MSKSLLRVRSDFIRVARCFTAGVTGVFSLNEVKHGLMMHNIYVEPHKSGTGVQIVSTDGAAMCLQWDKSGQADRPYIITGLREDHTRRMSGATLDDRWLEFSETDDATLMLPDNLFIDLDGVAIKPANCGPTFEPGAAQYVDWRRIVPSKADIELMRPGFPGMMNAAYMSIIGRLYQDGTANDREAHFLSHTGDLQKNVIVQFRWRPGMMLIIAPLVNTPSSDHWLDCLTNIVEGDNTTQADPADDL